MLPFFESYRNRDVPQNLAKELLNTDKNPLTKINDLKKVNIFVGANNSGKSRLIRELLKSNTRRYYGDNIWSEIKKAVAFYGKILEKMQEVYPYPDLYTFSVEPMGKLFSLEQISSSYKRFQVYTADYDIQEIISDLNNVFKASFEYDENRIYTLIGSNNSRHILEGQQKESAKKILQTISLLKEEKDLVIQTLKGYILNNNEYEKIKIYVPSIRSLRRFPVINSLTDQTVKESNLGTDVVVINGEQFPQSVFDAKNSTFLVKRKIIEFETFLSEEFFEKEKIEFTYNKDIQILHIKIGDETERPVYDLGDGIQMIIILTWPFFFKKGGVVAIEEPELFIHPGLQKNFIRFITSHPNARDFQIFIATHSNHIIDSINSSPFVSIFTIRKELDKNSRHLEKDAKFVIENIAHGHDNLLSLLGVTSTSVYLSNCSIWVEGITDKIYFQHFISEFLKSEDLDKKYEICKEFKEGIHYSFSLTGGDSILHWDFGDESDYDSLSRKIIVKKFCSKSMLIVDQDFGKNRLRKDGLKHLLGERFIELPVPEIENLLSPEVVCKTALTFSSVGKLVNNLSDMRITEEDLLVCKIGGLLDREIHNKYQIGKTFSVSSENGSLKSNDKFEFCQRSMPHINCYTLSRDARLIVKRILDFVISRNS